MRFEYLEKFATCSFPFIKDKTCIVVPILGDEYLACENPDMWCTSDENRYKQGIANTKRDPDLVERAGRLGECACSKLFGVDVDFSRIEGGDKGLDFTLHSGLTVDVKTSTSMGNIRYFGKNFIVAKTVKGKWKELIADIYIGAFLVKEYKDQKAAAIALTGWMNRNSVLANKDHKAPKTRKNPFPKHRNYEMPFHLQLPITDLVLGDREYARSVSKT